MRGAASGLALRAHRHYTVTISAHHSSDAHAGRDPRLLVRATRQRGTWQDPRAVVSQGCVGRSSDPCAVRRRRRDGARGRIRRMDLATRCARVLLLDQFTRNIYRETPRAFSGDVLALGISRAAVANGDDRSLIPVERWFLYMPFEHAEHAAAQQSSLDLFARLSDETGLSEPVVWAERHAEVIRRFGRYPHRNAILGRESTAEEIEYLAAGGRGF